MNKDREPNHRSERSRSPAELESEQASKAKRGPVRNFLARKPVQIAFFSLCVASFVAFGLLAIGRPASLQSQYDTRFCYDAGQAWLAGRSGYERTAFANPPQIAPLCTFLGLLAWDRARVAITILNVFCVGVITYLSLRLLRVTESPDLRLQGSGAEWYIAGMIIGNPFTAKTVWMGQMSAIVGAALLACWYCYRRGWWAWSGIFLAIATIKPQLSILIVLWFLLEQRWRILSVAAGGIFILILIPIAVNGPLNVLPDWSAALEVYKSLPENSLGWIGQAGLQNSIYLLTGFEVPSLFLFAVAIVLVLWVWRSQFLFNDIFGVLPMLSLLFGYGHYHDVIVLSLCIPLFWRHLREQPKAKLVTLGLLSALGATFGHALFHTPHEVFKMMLGFRAFILLALGGILLAMSHHKVISSHRERGVESEAFQLHRGR